MQQSNRYYRKASDVEDLINAACYVVTLHFPKLQINVPDSFWPKYSYARKPYYVLTQSAKAIKTSPWSGGYTELEINRLCMLMVVNSGDQKIDLTYQGNTLASVNVTDILFHDSAECDKFIDSLANTIMIFSKSQIQTIFGQENVEFLSRNY